MNKLEKHALLTASTMGLGLATILTRNAAIETYQKGMTEVMDTVKALPERSAELSNERLRIATDIFLIADAMGADGVLSAEYDEFNAEKELLGDAPGIDWDVQREVSLNVDFRESIINPDNVNSLSSAELELVATIEEEKEVETMAYNFIAFAEKYLEERSN